MTGSFIARRRCEDCGLLFERAAYKSSVFDRRKKDSWKCGKCGANGKGDSRSVIRSTRSYTFLIPVGSGTGRL